MGSKAQRQNQHLRRLMMKKALMRSAGGTRMDLRVRLRMSLVRRSVLLITLVVLQMSA